MQWAILNQLLIRKKWNTVLWRTALKRGRHLFQSKESYLYENVKTLSLFISAYSITGPNTANFHDWPLLGIRKSVPKKFEKGNFFEHITGVA